ncbi:peroxide stress protein YaaA [Nocardioides terrisoli]|uniref:peroxide stress protein YaaA n=1 Tax=Nocardioides terrisoli TaxID=3388267 RepID=UPI00287B9D44|nr:peroxide stress protein YaaA [Nocardioides marmorisolisilvae]
MLILLPPSEGKSAPTRGRPLDLARLDLPALTEARDEVLTALVEMCAPRSDSMTPLHDEVLAERAAQILGLGSTQIDQVDVNARLRTSPTTRADRLYTGVLYDALDLASLDGPARRRATRWLAITSSLFGLLRPHDPVPAYRLAGGVVLPGLGGVAAHWRRHLDPVVRDAAGRGLVIDLRSSTYAAFWRPAPDLADRVATVRVLHQVGSTRKVVSHFNKATKGRLVRALLEDGGAPSTPAGLADHLEALGWHVEQQPPTRTGQQLDIVVDEI